MTRQVQLGVALIVGGALANNYVYFHDLFFDKHAGAIYLGWISYVGIIVCLVAIAAGAMILLRSTETAGSN